MRHSVSKCGPGYLQPPRCNDKEAADDDRSSFAVLCMRVPPVAAEEELKLPSANNNRIEEDNLVPMMAMVYTVEAMHPLFDGVRVNL